jgi:NADPH:quinone reductase-like Zn-dependent oxidoreductase
MDSFVLSIKEGVIMSKSADAWVLKAGDPRKSGPGKLVREKISVNAIEANEVLVAPIFGCWEANMSHALERQPIDVCRFRNEPQVVLGNAGVVRIVEVGSDIKNLQPDQLAIVSPNGMVDRWGYTMKALGYDSPGRSGILATLAVLTEKHLILIPECSKYSLVQWAAFSARYVTAWSNWQLAYAVFHLLVPPGECPNPHVWGWGGGTTLAEIDLARRHGCIGAMLSGKAENLETIRRSAIIPVDRRPFSALHWDEERYQVESEYRREYKRAEELFLAEVERITQGDMVHIFVDYVGSPVYRATLKALSREGVITTAGWKAGMKLSHSRAEECISRHQHIHTHYAKYSQAVEAVSYAEATGWLPGPPKSVCKFDDIPELAERYSRNETDYFPCFEINA